MAKAGMISAPQPEAVDAGADILRAGGNAIDAAIACALTQCVVDPMMCSIAGLGTMSVYLPNTGTHEYFDFYAPAPAAVRPDMWEDLLEAESRDGFNFILQGRVNEIGYQSIGVPATLRGFELAHKEHGSLPWKELFAAAIHYAREGWTVRPAVHEFWSGEDDVGPVPALSRIKFCRSGRDLYCRNDGTAKRPGDRVVNKDYGDVLETIAREGAEAFHSGDIATTIVSDMEKNGGLITREDLRNVRVSRYAPLKVNYRDYEVTSNDSPGGGIVLLQMLKSISHFNLHEMEHNSTEYIKIVSEIMKYSTIDKHQYIGDPDFVTVPTKMLLSDELAAERAKAIESGERVKVPRHEKSLDSKHTTTLSVVDGDGNCVGLTHTSSLPSGVITEGLGFMYNGALSQFDPRPNRAGSLAPRKRRLSSMCPSMVFKENRPLMLLGAPGGTQIPMGLLQVILNTLDFEMPIIEAVSCPRFHATSDMIDVSNRISRFITSALDADGYPTVRAASSYKGCGGVHAIRVDGKLSGAADPWLDGMALKVNINVR